VKVNTMYCEYSYYNNCCNDKRTNYRGANNDDWYDGNCWDNYNNWAYDDTNNSRFAKRDTVFAECYSTDILCDIAVCGLLWIAWRFTLCAHFFNWKSELCIGNIVITTAAGETTTVIATTTKQTTAFPTTTTTGETATTTLTTTPGARNKTQCSHNVIIAVCFLM